MARRIELPARTRSKLDRFQKTLWRIKLTEGIFAAIFGLAVSYLMLFVVDRIFDTPTWVRWALIACGSIGLGVVLPWKFHRWIWQTRKLEQVAKQLSHRMPRLADRLLGVIELAQSDVEQSRSNALCAAALQQVDHEIRDTEFDDAVPSPRHRMWAWLVAVPSVIVLLGALFVPTAAWNAFQRWANPWNDTPRYTFAQIEDLPSTMVVPLGESITLDALLAEDSAWKPAQGRAQVAGQAPAIAERAGRKYSFPLAPQQTESRLSIRVGDDMAAIDLVPKQRPELTEVAAKVRLPDYLQRPEPEQQDVRGGVLSVLRGAEATLLASASRELASASWNGQAALVSDQRIETKPLRVDADTNVALTWQDQLGLPPKNPFQLTIETSEDRQPTIFCSELKRQQVVREDEVLSFEITADDDFGVKQIGIEWQGLQDPLTNPRPASGSAILSAGSPESASLTVRATFSAQRENIPPQTLQVRLFAVDYLPGRERVYSPPYTLFVLSQQDHANWLTERLKTWMRKAQGVYEREIQLYEENKALRELPSDQLSLKSTRQRIETQAAAETVNARQLRSLTETGKQLILDAAPNDQFNVATMEGLADMIQTLDDLAKNRMPSVANLLKRAALADDAKPDADNSQAPSQPGQQAPQVGNHRAPNGSSDGSDTAEQDATEDTSEKPPTPAIVDVESTMDDTQSPDDDSSQQQPPGKGDSRFGLPTTTVYGEVPQPATEDQPPPDIEEALDDAIDSQSKLLDEFTNVAEELQRILDNLEGSTFVKRLKASSRRQTEIARQLTRGLADKFAQPKAQLSDTLQQSTQEIVDQEQAEKSNLTTIQGDLLAYYQRVQEAKFGTVIREMDELQVMPQLDRLASLVEDNLHGQSIAHAEFWADTFDRWAEQLVGPGCPNGGAAPPGSKGDSLSPTVVLNVMKILEKEIGLREETRATQNLQDAVEAEVYQQRTESLADTQREIAGMNADVLRDIAKLEIEKGSTFPTEKNMLRQVGNIMGEVEQLLSAQQTDAPTIAAETEIIELLLKVQRKAPPKQKSKGNAGSQPGAGGEGDTEESALALIGRGDEAGAQRIERITEQTSGTITAGYPSEYRTGLDAYFRELESAAN